VIFGEHTFIEVKKIKEYNPTSEWIIGDGE